MAVGFLGTREAAEALWRHDVEWAEREMREKGRVPTMAAVHGRSGSMTPIVGGMDSEEQKDGFFAVVRLQGLADDAVAVTMIAEAWAVLGKVDPSVAPSRSPARQEVLMVVLSARLLDGSVMDLTAIRRIVRGEGGSVLGLEPVEIPGGGPELRVVGRLGELLPPEAPTLDERRKARAEAQRMLKRIKRGKPARPPGGLH